MRCNSQSHSSPADQSHTAPADRNDYGDGEREPRRKIPEDTLARFQITCRSVPTILTIDFPKMSGEPQVVCAVCCRPARMKEFPVV
jgi:hypothetical protein